MKRTLATLMVPIALLAVSCGSEGESKAPNLDMEVTEEISSNEEETRQKISIVFPSAVEIITVFENAGMEFEDGLTLPSENAAKFNTRTQRAIATGFYTADLAYCVINGKSQEAQDYLKTVISVSEELGITSVKNPDSTSTAFKSALGDKVKTLDVLEHVQQETDEFIEINDMQDLATVIFTGAWVEGMYLAIESNTDFNQTSISDRMVEQMFILNNVLFAMESVELSGDDYALYMKELEDLNTYFLNLDSVKKAGEESFPQLSLVELEGLASRITAIRKAHS